MVIALSALELNLRWCCFVLRCMVSRHVTPGWRALRTLFAPEDHALHFKRYIGKGTAGLILLFPWPVTNVSALNSAFDLHVSLITVRPESLFFERVLSSFLTIFLDFSQLSPSWQNHVQPNHMGGSEALLCNLGTKLGSCYDRNYPSFSHLKAIQHKVYQIHCHSLCFVVCVFWEKKFGMNAIEQTDPWITVLTRKSCEMQQGLTIRTLRCCGDFLKVVATVSRLRTRPRAHL